MLTPTVKDALRAFARNARWGTCVDCPQDGDQNKLPELCVNTERYDHQLDIEKLANQVNVCLNAEQTAFQPVFDLGRNTGGHSVLILYTPEQTQRMAEIEAEINDYQFISFYANQRATRAKIEQFRADFNFTPEKMLHWIDFLNGV